MRIVKILSITLVLVFLLAACKSQTVEDKEVTLNYWGVYEPQENLTELINEFQSQNPKIKINYTRKGLKEYKQQIIARAGKENGPDLFRYHNSWIPELRSILATTPQTTVDQIKFDQSFYPVALKDLKFGTGYQGIPLMYDGLGLYYNTTLFEQAAIDQPPLDWDKVIAAAEKLTSSPGGKIQIAGLAFGQTENVDYWPDIIALLMEQNNASQLNPAATTAQTQLVLDFFRRSGNSTKPIWDKNWVNSTEAFAQGKVAMIFGNSWTAFEIQSKNPNLKFAVAPVPQLPGDQIGIASYWVEGVTNTTDTAKSNAAWKFLAFLAQKENQQRLFAIQGKTRLFGEPYSLISLAPELKNNQYLNGIMQTAPGARSTYLSDKTFGAGFNDDLITLYKSMLTGETNIDDSTQKIQAIVKKYGIK